MSLHPVAAAASARALAIAASRYRLPCEKPDIAVGSGRRFPLGLRLNRGRTLAGGAENKVAALDPRQGSEDHARRFGQVHVVRLAVFHSGPRQGPTTHIVGDLRPAHAGDFLAPLQGQDRQLEERAEWRKSSSGGAAVVGSVRRDTWNQ
jgi:hypothetical protein